MTLWIAAAAVAGSLLGWVVGYAEGTARERARWLPVLGSFIRHLNDLSVLVAKATGAARTPQALHPERN